MSLLRQAVRQGWRYPVIGVLIGLTSYYLGDLLPQISAELQMTLFGPKLTFVALVSAGIAFYYKLLWDDIDRAISFEKLALYYSRPLGLLIVSALLALVSISGDFADFLQSSQVLSRFSLSLFMFALFLLALFLLLVFVRAFGHLQTLKDVKKLPQAHDLTGIEKILLDGKEKLEMEVNQIQKKLKKMETDLNFTNELLKKYKDLSESGTQEKSKNGKTSQDER